MARGKVELRRIENQVSRQVTFSKRCRGLLKKAHELAVLCDVELGVVVFSERGKLFEYSNPPASLSYVIHRYEAATNIQLLQETYSHNQQMIAEMGKLRHEHDQLEDSLRRCTGEDVSSLTSVDELAELERQLESALGKVRARKDELLTEMTEELILKINENGKQHDDAAAAMGMETEPLPSSPSFACLLAVEEASAASTMLQLWPQTTTDDDDVRRGGGGSGLVGSSSARGLQLW